VSDVVVLSWQIGTRTLEYVQINEGSGGSRETVTVNPETALQVSEELEGKDLPWSAELVTLDGDLLMDASQGVHLQRCSVTAVGSPGDPGLNFKPKGPSKPYSVRAAALGIESMPLAQRAASTLEYLYAAELSPPGCWLGEGGLEHVRQLQRQHDDDRQLEDERKRQAAADRLRQEEADKRFVNPYTFVPFPETVARCAPAGHHLLGIDRLSGNFTVTWRFTTPFQAPQGASGTVRLRLPGSSVKGAVRSVHETLAGGCLRVFDERFVPSYRDIPAVPSGDWTLALVSKSTKDGQALVVQLCDEVVWADARQLRRACGGSLSTGSRVTVRDEDVPAAPNSLGRKELGVDTPIGRGGDWVVLVTSRGTRTVEKKTYLLACGKLGPRTAEVTDAAWVVFRIAAAGADDRRRSLREQLGDDARDHRPMRDVVFGSEPIGRCRVTTGWLWPGDIVWVRTAFDGGQWRADELRLAAIWRHPGWPGGADPQEGQERWQAGSRVPEDLRPCSDPVWLCPTCRVFGSADQQARDRADPAQQRAYAGHVRFGDACSAEPVKLTMIRRAPMGAPRPGAGQFYLAVGDRRQAAARERRPTREWGSDPEATEPRRLRGRKFYWHADPTTQDPPRHVARPHQEAKNLATDQWIASAGTALSQRITFDNLSPAELGSLLAAFEPQRVLGQHASGELRLHLGGGKPLGLGSCAAVVSGLRVWSAASRYGGGSEVISDGDGYVAQFAGACPEDVRGTWPALAAVLGEDSVDAGHVWYPPGAYWGDRADGLQRFDEPFAFFTGTSGMFLQAKAPRAIVPLPAPGAGDQNLPVIRKDDLR